MLFVVLVCSGLELTIGAHRDVCVRGEEEADLGPFIRTYVSGREHVS